MRNIPIGDNVIVPKYKVGDILTFLNTSNKYVVDNVLFSPYYQKYYYVLILYGKYKSKLEFHGLKFVEDYFYKE